MEDIYTNNEVVDRVKKGISGYYSYFANNITQYRNDRLFYFGQQWETQVAQEYNQQKKPTLTIDLVGQFVRKISGDQRKSEIYVNALPKIDESPQEYVDIFNQILKNILVTQKTKNYYALLLELMLSGGFGVLEVYTDYRDSNSFEQDIFIRVAEDPVWYFFDPKAREANFSDGDFCGSYELMSKHEFKTLYPDSKTESISYFMPPNSPFYNNYYYQDFVIFVNFFEKQYKKITLVELSNGINFKHTCNKKDLELVKQNYYNQYLSQGIPMDEVPVLYETNRRQSIQTEIHFYKLVGEQILEHKIWPSQYLPFIFCGGDFINYNGQLLTRSFIFTARDAQRFYNFSVSEIAQALKTSRRAPLMITTGQVEGLEDMYRNINHYTGSLIYRPDPLATTPPYQLQNQEVSQSFFLAATQASEDIRKVLGMVDPITGGVPNPASGVAMDRSQAQQNLVVIGYIQKIYDTIQHAAMIVKDILPKIYDSERQIMSTEDNKTTFLKINQFEQETMMNDIESIVDAIGQITVDGSASYMTEIKEFIDIIIRVIQLIPGSGQLVADLIPKQLDTPMKNELVQRLKYLVPEYVLKNEPQPPTPPNPEVQLKQQELQLKAEQIQSQSQNTKIQMLLEHIQAQQELEKAKIDNLTKLMNEKLKSTAEIHKANLEFMRKE